VALENIARSQKYPCANRQSGCLGRFSIEHIAKHHDVCVYGKIKCPFHLLKMCSWNGLKNDLKEHAKAAHPGHYWEGSTFFFRKFSDNVAIVSQFGELFTCYQKIKDGRFYAAVQLFGTSSNASKYKCEFKLHHSAKDFEWISKTVFVRGYSEDWETIFNSGKCFCLDEKKVKYFLEPNNLQFAYFVTMSTV
jgi:hypothetical protein